jgi:hypothetical protein
VWYKTNKTDNRKTYSGVSAMNTNPDNPKNPQQKAAYPNTGFKLWAKNLTTTERHKLSVSDLKLAKGEYITALRFEHGGVDVGFTSKNYADVSLNGEHREGDAAAQTLSTDSGAVMPLATGITGNTVDWTPHESDPFYAAGAKDATGLKPVSYLVSTPRAYEDEDIAGSVTARITRDYTLRDDDADRVVTKEIQSFAYEPAAPEPKIESTFGEKTDIPELAVPQTGDSFMLWIWISLIIIAISGIFSLVMVFSSIKKGGETRE